MNPNLEMQVNKTNAGLYTVTYGRKEAPLNVQEASFASNKLGMISPAQLGFLRANAENANEFSPYSRTNADVFYDDKNNKVVIVPDGAISKQVGIADLVDAHREGKEYVIPKNQRDLVYAMVDEMLKKGTAFTAKHGQTDIPVSEFGQTELTSRLFSDESLGINAQDYGNWLKKQGRSTQSMFFDNEGYTKSQKGPYTNRLRVGGPDFVFLVVGYLRYLVNNFGAFGVRFEKTAEGGPKK
ncbi:MAG TPA: hypothetical protein VJJ52_04310 [Candidatus Nanoarchaeia archaeon]|nr:hypothetical protein [Candidatus Nanoarchaeia archaeon]